MNTTSYLLDSNICIFFLRNQYGIEEHIRRIGIEKCFISEISMAELLYGAFCSSCPAENLELVKEFCSFINILPIFDSLETYALEKSKLRKKGLLIDDFDLLIGATAISHDLVLVTENTKHFERLNLNIENWVER